MPTHITSKTLASSAEQRIDLAISAARIKHLWLSSTVDLTIKTNDAATGTPVDTLTLVAGHATDYSAASGATGPFSADVTAFYVTPASAGTLYVRVLQDSTA